MPTAPPPNGEPYARGSVIHGFRAAVVDLWGEAALGQIAELLPVGTRMATVEGIVLPFEWIPLQHVIAWHEALWRGPSRGDEGELARLVGRSIELGLGRFKSAFFAGITPARLVERAPELWRWQHTHGVLTARIEGQTGTVMLSDHPYVGSAPSRRLTAESYRYIVTMAGGRDVRAAWSAVPRGGAAAAATTLAGAGAGASGGSSAGGSSTHTLVVRLSWAAARG